MREEPKAVLGSMTVQPFEPATRQVIPRRIDASPNVVAMHVIIGVSSIGSVDTTRLPGGTLNVGQPA
jgi:hypothetical protein